MHCELWKFFLFCFDYSHIRRDSYAVLQKSDDFFSPAFLSVATFISFVFFLLYCSPSLPHQTCFFGVFLITGSKDVILLRLFLQSEKSVQTWSVWRRWCDSPRSTVCRFLLLSVLSPSYFFLSIFTLKRADSCFTPSRWRGGEKKENRLWCKKRVHECWDSCVQHTT